MKKHHDKLPLGCLLLLLTASVILPQAQAPFKYDIKVDILVIPVFAVNENNEPVFDLTENDIQLYVNRKRTPINAFNRYTVESETNLESVKNNGGRKSPGRFLFIIIDSMFSGTYGLRRAREIAAGIVDRASAGDAFIILENNAGTGLRYVVGPTGDRLSVKRMIDSIKQLPEQRAKTRNRQSISHFLPAEEGLPDMFDRHFNDQKERKDREADRFQYKTDLKYFAKVLAEFKNALIAITRPKIVFLISEGISSGAFDEEGGVESPGGGTGLKKTAAFHNTTSTLFNNQHVYFEYLRKVAGAINEGGGVLYTVNPRRLEVADDNATSGEESLRYMASEGGGRYFEGPDTGRIVERIVNTTAAYYEIFCSPPAAEKDQIRLKIISIRPGVRIHTIKYTEGKRSYKDLSGGQKKLYALNVVTGGIWSRMSGAVERMAFGKLAVISQKNKRFQPLEILIPPALADRPLDIFIIMLDPISQKADIGFKNETATHRLRITVPLSQLKTSFVTIIEPATGQCIYGRIN